MRGCARRNAARSRTSATTNGAPQVARHGGCRRASISEVSSEQACAIIAGSKSRMIRNCWGAAKAAPVARPSIRVECHSDESGYFLEDHVPAIEAAAADLVLARQNKRRADVWMARKRHLGARRKNAHPSSVRRIIRRQDKRCLGKVKLVGDRLHSSVRKAARIGNHRQRVAAELPIGEYINRLELHSHKRYVPAVGCRSAHRTHAPIL